MNQFVFELLECTEKRESHFGSLSFLSVGTRALKTGPLLSETLTGTAAGEGGHQG